MPHHDRDGVIGPAEDFWRLRLTRIDATTELDFEWHEDILWRQPEVREHAEEEAYLVEAVSLDRDPEVVVRLGAFPDADSARARMGEIDEDLRDMTRSQFEAAYPSDAE